MVRENVNFLQGLPMSQQLPAILQSIQQPVTIDLFGSASEEQGRQQVIMHHAMAVIKHFQDMNASAVQVCIHLFMCREEFKVGGESGWESFCKANFEGYGLSNGKIRQAVRAGRSLAHLSKRMKDAEAEMPDLNGMSRAALFILCDAPPDVQDRLIIEMSAANEDNSGKGPTAIELRRRIEELQAEATESKDLLKEKDLALKRLGDALDAREADAAQTRDQLARLNRKLTTPVDHVVHKLPHGVESEQVMLERITEEVSFKKTELARTEAEINRLKIEKTQYEVEMAAKQQAKEVLVSLDADIKSMMLKYTDALMQKLSNTDPVRVTPLLDAAAQRLRALANQLAPSLV